MIRVLATQVGVDKCRLVLATVRNDALVFLIDREIPLNHSDCTTVERSAVELATTDLDALLALYNPNAIASRRVRS